MATNKKYLSKEGLTHLVELIKNGTAAKDHTHDFSDLSGGIAHELSGEVIEQKLVNGNGSVGELTVYGATRQNLWVNPATLTAYGVTFTSNANGSVTLSGTSTQICNFEARVYSIRPGTTYTLSIDKPVPGITSGYGFYFDTVNTGAKYVGNSQYQTENTFVAPEDANVVTLGFYIPAGATVSGTYRVMLNEGEEAEPWCPPGLNGVEELEVVCAGKNLLARMGPELPYTTAGITFSDNGDGGIRVSGTATAAVYYNFFNVSATRALRIPPGTYIASLVGGVMGGINLNVEYYDGRIGVGSKRWLATHLTGALDTGSIDRPVYIRPFISIASGRTVDTVLYPQLELGSTATAYEPPAVTTTPIDLDGHTLNALPDGTRDELRVDGTGAVTLVQRVGVYVADGDEGWELSALDAAPYRMCVQNWDPNALNGVLGPDKFLSTVLPASGIDGYENGSFVVINGRYQLYAGRTGVTTADAFSKWLKTLPMTVLYPLATPNEVELPGISMPSANADTITVLAASNVPTELDATIIDLPVVPISSGGTGATTASGARTGLDVYSKAEVDAKVGDAIDLPLAVSKGGTGAVTSLAANYNLLNSATQRASNTVIKDDTNAAFFTEAPSTTAGALQKIPFLAVWNYIVAKIRYTFGFSSSNVLPISHGGTGATTAKAAQNALLGNMNEVTTDSTDTSEFVMCFTDPTDNNGAVCKRKAPHVWNWIKTKADEVYAAKSHTHTTHGGTKIEASTNLNTLQSPGWYYCLANATAATLTNCPTDNAFALIVSRHAGYNQLLIEYMTSGYKIYARNLYVSTWGSWIRLYTTIDKPTPSEIGAAASSHDHSAANITSGTLPISRGGTGMTANPAMLVNLASASTANVFGSAPRPGVTGTLPVSNGGTGATAKGTTLLSNIGITISSSEAPATGTPGTIHIQLLD